MSRIFMENTENISGFKCKYKELRRFPFISYALKIIINCTNPPLFFLIKSLLISPNDILTYWQAMEQLPKQIKSIFQ